MPTKKQTEIHCTLCKHPSCLFSMNHKGEKTMCVLSFVDCRLCSGQCKGQVSSWDSFGRFIAQTTSSDPIYFIFQKYYNSLHKQHPTIPFIFHQYNTMKILNNWLSFSFNLINRKLKYVYKLCTLTLG